MQYQKLNNSMYTLNEAWASTTNDLVVQGRHLQGLDERAQQLEIEHVAPSEIRKIEQSLRIFETR